MIKWKSSKLKLRSGESEVEEYKKCIDELIHHDNVQMMKQFKHHHSITCFEHSVNVSLYSYLICRIFGLDYKSAARGGLLHDLFLYDWRTTKISGGKHAFIHPKIALSNASALFRLNYIEQDIILKH
ncbi:MAG TPA: HD family phosphohydrolase, partial [Bacteroidales bacterium]|nr:HD family phosphohydrolase [Bacteroidales bacterium]